MRKLGPVALGFHAAFIAFILAPLAMVVAVSFTDKGYLSLPTDGLSLRWYQAILDNPDFIDAFLISVWLGFVMPSEGTFALGSPGFRGVRGLTTQRPRRP